MEDVLNLYEKPLDPKEPVVCLDERPVQLLAEVRDPIPADRPGTILKRDNEYKRQGTANIFCVVEPKAGRHLNTVTKNRSGLSTARKLAQILDAYPRTRTIHLVMDNLNTHGPKGLIELYGEKKGRTMWKRFTPHYTPLHGSWLNQAEMEVSLVSRQCLGKDRIGDIASLRQRVQAGNRWLNRKRTTIGWQFTVQKARQKFHYTSHIKKIKGMKH